MIALMGLDAETGVFMLLFLDLVVRRGERRRAGCARAADLDEAIIHGAVKRVRPEDDDRLRRLHRACCPSCGPPGTGADMMKRIAAPMVGGLVTSFMLELLGLSRDLLLWKGHHFQPDALETTAETGGDS